MADATTPASAPQPSSRPGRAARKASAQAMAQWPLTLALMLVAGGVAWAGLGHWRRGSFVLGVGVVLAGLERWVLPTSAAGILAVRRRSWDVALLLGMGAGIIVLTFIVPPMRP